MIFDDDNSSAAPETPSLFGAFKHAVLGIAQAVAGDEGARHGAAGARAGAKGAKFTVGQRPVVFRRPGAKSCCAGKR